MKSRLLIIVLVISLGVNIGFLLHCFWPQCPLAKKNVAAVPCGWHTSTLRHDLGLSPKQVSLMENERRNVLVQLQPLQKELRQKRRELFVLLKNKTVTDAELDVALSEISLLQAAIEKMFILHSVKVKRFFTPVQLQKYDGFFEQGLCPGMMSEKACPPGKMSGREPGRSGCENRQNEKK